jgi:hypothetical protein
MRYLKSFESYIKESITTDIDGLLDSIREEKTDFYSLDISNDDYIDKDIQFLYDDDDFNNQLFKNNLKKGDIESTLDIENLLRKDIDMKFFFLYSRNKTVLDNPEYLIIQYYKDDKWYPIEIYIIKGNIKNFYDKLTAKTIKLTYDDVVYIYDTSNSGNNWILKDKQKRNIDFKETLETPDIKNLIKKGASLKIIE